MIIVLFLLCVSLVVAVFFLFAYVWGVKSGQFDDDYSPAHRIFYEDKPNNSDVDINNTNANNPNSKIQENINNNLK